MKLVRTLSLISTFAIIAGAAALAGEGKDKGSRGGQGPIMEHLLPPRVVDDLNLTADQKTKFSEIEGSFKKDAEAWKKKHAGNPEEFRKAKEAGDKETLKKLGADRKELMETRKGYVDKFRDTLTAEQKKTLDDKLAEMRERGAKGPRGEKPAKD